MSLLETIDKAIAVNDEILDSGHVFLNRTLIELNQEMLKEIRKEILRRRTDGH